MPGHPTNNSFIPKRGPSKRKPGARSQRIQVFTIISYVLFFGALIAAGATFLYYNLQYNKYSEAVKGLQDSIKNFNQRDMFTVLEFNDRVKQASSLLDSHVSMVSLLQVLEAASLKTVQIKSANINRGPEGYNLELAFVTDSFDSTIFQRDVYKENDTIASIEVKSVTAQDTSLDPNNESDNTSVLAGKKEFIFKAELSVPVDAILYDPSKNVSGFVNLSNLPELPADTAAVSGDVNGQGQGESVDIIKDVTN